MRSDPSLRWFLLGDDDLVREVTAEEYDYALPMLTTHPDKQRALHQLASSSIRYKGILNHAIGVTTRFKSQIGPCFQEPYFATNVYGGPEHLSAGTWHSERHRTREEALRRHGIIVKRLTVMLVKEQPEYMMKSWLLNTSYAPADCYGWPLCEHGLAAQAAKKEEH